MNRSIAIFCTCIWLLYGQSNKHISGRVIDSSTNEPLYGVNILIQNTYLGTSTDQNGEFIIDELADRPYDLNISMIGYKKYILSNVVPELDHFLTIELPPVFSKKSMEHIISFILDITWIIHYQVLGTMLTC